MHAETALAQTCKVGHGLCMTKTPSLTIRRSAERGRFNHGWLDTRHTFSFGDYYDPAHMGFRSLRVINDDYIAPGAGFPTHPHRDMEIFSYVLEGALAHKDSMGNQRVLKPGEIQLMRAGSGITHSEFNPSSTQQARLLQIWILPEQRGLIPDYTEWSPPSGLESDKMLIISRDGRDGSARIAQDADIYRILTTSPETSLAHEVRPGRGIWLHVIRGEAHLGDVRLSPGDAAAIEEAGTFEIRSGTEPLEALLFDLN